MRQSVFTLLMVEQGLINGAADTNGDGRVSIQEAWGYAAHRAPLLTARQAQGPQHPVMAGWDGTPLYLDAVASPPAPPEAAKTCILFLCL